MRLLELKPITEGGNMLKQVGVGKINKSDIPATLQYVSQLSGIPESEFTLLGSVGKKPQSGDIDIALAKDQHNAEAVHARMEQALPEKHAAFMKGLNIGSYAIPIAGNEENGLVQVDFMYVDNPRWAKFAYHSPDKASKYKGAIRTILLMAVAAQYSEPGTDQFIYDDGELIVRLGRTMDLNQGLRRIFQHKPAKARGTGRVKNMKTVKTVDELKDLYPSIEVHGDQIVVDDPQQVLDMLFGGGVTPDMVDSAEEVIKVIKKKFNKKQQQAIFDKAKGRGFNADWDIPPELQ